MSARDTPIGRVPQPVQSEEQFATVSDGIRLCYQTFGDPAADPLLLVMGMGGPMTWWDAELCRMLAGSGFFVIRYDNRDTGRSSRVDGLVRRNDVVRAFLGGRVRGPYTMADLACDGFGLLDHLGIERSHVVGVSMGGMIAQTMAIAEPDRVLSLTSIQSTTGHRLVGWQHPSLLPNLLGKGVGREAYIESSVKIWRRIGSPGFPRSDEDIRARAAETYDRGVSAAGVLRQMMAVLTQPDRSRDLRNVKAPTLVIHGLADKLVHVSGGRATSRAVPGAELLLIDGMGHDLPPELYQTFVSAIRRTADRAGRTPRSGGEHGQSA